MGAAPDSPGPAREECEGLPDEARCLALLAGSGLSEKRIAHSHAVTRVAVALAGALNDRGLSLCLPLVRAGGLLHDIGRAEENHPEAGAHMVEEWGYPRVAAVVRLHMDLGGPAGDAVDEARVVFLADKLVRGDHVVGLERRFAVRYERYASDPAMLAATARREEQARSVLALVEGLLGRPVTDVLPAGISGA